VNTYGSARVGPRNGPAGLGDPDPLAGRNPVNNVAGGLYRCPEDVRGALNGTVLEVRVSGELLVSSL
jgi:hypothetical protein